MCDISYSKLMHGLKAANIDINRKMLADLAVNDEKAFRTLTEKMTGKSEVVKHSLYSNSNQPESGDVRQNLGKERYIEGTLLAEQWKKLLEIKPREELFFELATEYYHFIEGQVLAAGSTASLIDLTPMNIIVTPSGKWTSFDQEWETKQTPPIETIFVRGLFFLS